MKDCAKDVVTVDLACVCRQTDASFCVIVLVFVCVSFHLPPAAAICYCSPSPFAFIKKHFNSRLAEVAAKLNRRL